MKNLLEAWDRFLNEENNAEKLDKSNEVREFINSLSDEATFSEIKSAIFDKFIDYPDVKDVVVYEAGQEYEGSRPSVVITFEEGKGIPPFDESLSIGFDFEEQLDEKKKKKDDRCTRIAKRKYDVWPSAYASGAVVKCRQGKIWKGVKEDVEASELLENSEYEDLLEEAKKKKAGTESSKESSLRDWFKRKGAKGKTGGWVDCNAPDGKGGYKPCGRQEGEKRSKYPACRPTPGACKERGKGKSWGKKAAKKESLERRIEKMVIKELQEQLFKPGLKHHVDNNIPLTENIYRIGSPCYFNVIKQGREYYKMGLYETTNPDEIDLFENTDLGEWAMFEGEEVPLDFPMYEETLEEAKKKKKKDPPIGKPTKNTGGGKKYKVYVRNPKTGNIKKITYGDSKGGLKGNWNNAEARKSFAARHNCAEKKDRTKSGYWACRAHKDFGKNVPGRFW